MICTPKNLTVRDLIDILQTMPQDMLVMYSKFSEHCLLEYGDIEIVEACAPRPDGWVQNARPDHPLLSYVSFPG